ncbi:Preprotein translocase YajC subunit [Flavobacterium indicum GPTSA100-9 = DSM 17447]|uniref:Sec translocon accessory complex subunit YajC n=1 Tax=Flavobacterium indicum (strain DSM 17447 / CIP 109464 / GPTSA100-9) TaxID=1094466 RepID=H8XTG7_FLAIG|nr:preprotein translocase subunit YajC [Flavobacterium indicum]CCG52764.1 Preprotein translocase YajC subunit [Flavobacterium indicum GPTSA100-9 = DSM 17447]
MKDGMIFIQLGLMIAVFYFLIIMPQRKRIKQEKTFEANLKVGDKVITKAGIHGKIAEIAETTIVLETMSGKIKMEKNAIAADLTIKLNEKK